jgi:uncharacterized protein YlxW (UPF0749 family)
MNKTKINIKNKMVIVAAFIVGILTSTYTKTLNPNNVYITLEQKRNLELEIENSKLEIEKLKETLKNQKESLREYETFFKDSDKSIMDLLEEELLYYEMLSGASEVTGEGIILKISDSEIDIINEGNPNDLIVHDIDILRIINDLKSAEAKAISINGERVISTSQIKCSGATITINDTTYGQPFIIKAIGDIDILKASIISPNSYASLLTDVYSINIKIEEKNDIIINSYKKYT